MEGVGHDFGDDPWHALRTATEAMGSAGAVGSLGAMAGIGPLEAAKCEQRKSLHSAAERDRRSRINERLAYLGTRLPEGPGKHKATLLAQVIEELTRLEQRNKEESEDGPVPSNVESVEVERELGGGNDGQDGALRYKATICCKMRPDIFLSLKELVKASKLSLQDMQMVNVLGWATLTLVLRAAAEGDCSGSSGSVCRPDSAAEGIKDALWALVDPSKQPEAASSSGTSARKRQRCSPVESTSRPSSESM